MVERKGKFNFDETRSNLIPRVLTAARVEQIVEDVIKMQRDEAERRRRLGIPKPEAPGLTDEARHSEYRDNCRIEEDLGSITVARQLTVRGNVGR